MNPAAGTCFNVQSKASTDPAYFENHPRILRSILEAVLEHHQPYPHLPSLNSQLRFKASLMSRTCRALKYWLLAIV